MPEFKKQHFLPAVYLGQFGRPPERELRKREIFRVGASHDGWVSVVSQCQENYFYSRDRATLCETYFGTVEGIYGQLVAAATAQVPISRESMFLLFLCAVDFYARNVKFKGSDAEVDGFGLYLKRMEIFKRELIGPGLRDSDDSARRAHILAHWDFGFVTFPENACILTSDCPSIWLGSKTDPTRMKGVLLPITMARCFVAVHRGDFRIVATSANEADSKVMNLNQIANCVSGVYFGDTIEAQQVDLIRQRIAANPPPTITTAGWQIELLDYAEKPDLSFLRAG